MIPAKPSRPGPGDAAVTLRVHSVYAPGPLVVEAGHPTALVPIESAIAAVTLGADVHTLDRSCLLVLPTGAQAEVRPTAAVTQVAVLGLPGAVFPRVLAAYAHLGAREDRWRTWTNAPALLPRTVWVHEVVHRYVFERHALDQHDTDAVRFLEVEFVKELYFLFRDRDEGADRATIQQKLSPPVERALAFIDAHLFERHPVKAIAAHAGCSESSLLRAFRREVGHTPAAWWRRRKLDGALDLLRAGHHSVADVAEQIGYDNPTAFGDAFRRRFGRPPSTFKPKHPIKSPP